MNSYAKSRRTWTDDQLREAIRASRSWRGVMKELGLKGTGGTPYLRRRAKYLGISFDHFTSLRQWSDSDLRRAVATAHSWPEVVESLGLAITSGNRTHVRNHALRLGLDLSGLDVPSRPELPAIEEVMAATPDLQHLRTTAESIAILWFGIRGFDCGVPSSPTVYDLLVDLRCGIKRVQVKSSTCNIKGAWNAQVGHRPSDKRTNPIPYNPDDLDLFFIIDGDFNIYLIPSQLIAGRVRIVLSAWRDYIVGNARGLIETASPGDLRPSLN